MKTLNFSDGLEEYRLNDRVSVHFNPTDVGFLEKLTETYEKLDALQEELNAARSTLTEAEVFSFARGQDAKMRTVLDSLFDKPICDVLFGPLNLYASAGGFPVWANFMIAITDEVKAAMKGELAAREKRIAKYTEKYTADNKKGSPVTPR